MCLDKKEAKCLQGIAILFMLGLHLFNRSDITNYYDVNLYIGNDPLLTKVSFIFDACVPIYLFCSGYGLYISEKKGSCLSKRIHRILKLLLRYWIIMSLTCLVSFLPEMSGKFEMGGGLNFVLNALLLKNTYVGSFWFVQTYTLLALLSGFFFKYIQKYSHLIVLFTSILFYVGAFGIEYIVLNKIQNEPVMLIVNAAMLLMRSQFSFVVGMIASKNSMIENCKILKIIRDSQILPWIFLIPLIVIRSLLPHMIFAPFSAFALIVLFGTYNWGKVGKNILLFFGKHSTNMWLTHMQFYMIFTPTLVFGSRNVFLIMLTLIMLSLMASYIINILYDFVVRIFKLGFN